MSRHGAWTLRFNGVATIVDLGKPGLESGCIAIREHLALRPTRTYLPNPGHLAKQGCTGYPKS